jgi:hypothetical protein
LPQFADYISLEVRAVTVDDDGLLSRDTTDPEEDDTMFVPYLPFLIVESPADFCIIQYSKFKSSINLTRCCLSSYEDKSGDPQRVAFKFDPLGKPQGLQVAWDEINLLKILPPQLNLVLSDRAVLEEIESQVIRFTPKYISGGNLDNLKVPFPFEWI